MTNAATEAIELIPEIDRTRQCTATNQNGQRCKRAPIKGGWVCNHHGGRIPAVRESARHRLLAMVEPAMAVLERATRQAPPCEVCGRSDADRDPVAVRAAGMIWIAPDFRPPTRSKSQRHPPTSTVCPQPTCSRTLAGWLNDSKSNSHESSRAMSLMEC